MSRESRLRSRCFQSSYGAKVKKKGGGRGKEEDETLARKPHDSGKRPSDISGFGSFVN